MKRILFIMPFTIPITELVGDNTGNYVYYLAVYSYLFGIKKLTCLSPEDIQQNLSKDKDYVKKNFDIAIIPQANFFSVYYKYYIINDVKFINSLKIPFFVLGIGCQNDIEHNLKNLQPINDDVKKYVDAVLNSGGMLTLRGELTNSYLKSLGYKDIPVLGCPSMYINGLSFKISNQKVSLDKFKPMYNAQYVQDIDKKLYDDYPNSVFFDQDRYLKALFYPEKAKDDICLQNERFINLYEKGRIRGDINYYPWQRQIIEGNFNFSYGSRVHGNIIAIQNKIPAFVKVIDSRTREIAEFYNIPNSLQYPFNEKNDSLYDLYKTISYTTFNKKYPEKFNQFKDFLSKITGISKDDYILNKNENFMTYLSNVKYPVYDKNYQASQRAKKLIEYLKSKKHHSKFKKIIFKIRDVIIKNNYLHLQYLKIGNYMNKLKKDIFKANGVALKNNTEQCQIPKRTPKSPKISITMPCYNSEKFIRKTIDSILAQTYLNWELLCVNDMSTDNTLDILNQYAQKDKRIKIFDKKEKGGKAAPNSNYAVENATGDFIFPLGHDDTLSKDLFEKVIKRQQETNADIVIPDCCFVYPSNSNKNWTMAGVLKRWGKTNKKINRDIILTGRQACELSLNWRIHGFNLFKAEIVKKCKYCEKGMNGDEYSVREFYLQANTVAFSQGTYFYYQLDSSITKKMSPKLWDVYWAPYLLEKLLIENNFDFDLVKNMQYTRLLLYKRLFNLYKKNKENFSKEEQEKIENYLSENRKLLKSSGLNADRFYLLSLAGKVFMKIKLKLTRPKYE